MAKESIPNFSVYRKPFNLSSLLPESAVKAVMGPNSSHLGKWNILTSLVLHILFMKSTNKRLARNFNAEDLESLCMNRFYGPIVVALNVAY